LDIPQVIEIFSILHTLFLHNLTIKLFWFFKYVHKKWDYSHKKIEFWWKHERKALKNTLSGLQTLRLQEQ